METFSTKTLINLSNTMLFETMSNPQNIAYCLSDQVQGFLVMEDRCSFTVENIAKVSLKVLEKTPCTMIRFTAENDRDIPIFLTLNFTTISENETDVTAELKVDIPIFLRPVLQRHLQRFTNTLSERIKTDTEKLRP